MLRGVWRRRRLLLHIIAAAYMPHLQWVVRYSAGELHKFAKCFYELEQGDLIRHLVVSSAVLSRQKYLQLTGGHSNDLIPAGLAVSCLHAQVVDPLAQETSALAMAAAGQRTRLWHMHVEPPVVSGGLLLLL